MPVLNEDRKVEYLTKLISVCKKEGLKNYADLVNWILDNGTARELELTADYVEFFLAYFCSGDLEGF